MIIHDGVVTGKCWHTKKIIHIPLAAVRLIQEDAGNSPPADRVYYLDGNLEHRDLMRDGE